MDPSAGLLGGLAALPCFFICGFGSLGLLAFAFWIWMLIDCITKEPSTNNEKIVWILVIVLLHFLGALLYLLVRRPQRIRETGQ